MQNNNSININEFSGIYRKMAETANVNGGETLDIVEISIFNEINTTYNRKNNTFMFQNELYNESGKIEQPGYSIEKTVSTGVNKIHLEDMSAELKNLNAIEKAKKFAKKAMKSRNKTIRVHKYVNGRPVAFSYNIVSLENYIINDSVDSQLNKITYFQDIPKIRAKQSALRTKEECKKLIEFNNMVNSAVQAGVDYGVDPKLIIAIMQREVCFDGLSDKVTGTNGKGYMQITTAPVRDILGGYTKNGKLFYEEGLKTLKYGPEVEELLKSRGFNTKVPPPKRTELVDQIMNYLKKNKDADFNIRLGTIILRHYLNKSEGNIKLAVQNYNGNSKNNIKYAYGNAVNSYYNQMCIKQNRSNKA